MNKERLEHDYRARRADGPPPELDRAVLAHARRALAHDRDVDRNRGDWRPSRGAWWTGVATASVAVLALAVVLQQAVPPTAAPDSESVFTPGSPPTAPDRQLNLAEQERARRDADDSIGAAPSEPRASESVSTDDLMRRTRPARELPPARPESAPAVAPLEEAAEARPRQTESRSGSPETDFEPVAPAQLKSIAAESDEVYVNAGDPTLELKKARRALLIRVRVALARGDEDAARAAIEDHLAIDPELRLPQDLRERLWIEPPPEPD